MPATLQQLTEALLDAALRAGAEAADALAMDGASIGIDLRAGALEKAERAEGTDIGLRVLIAGRQACVSASDTSPATILAIAERAVAMAREAPEDPYVGLASAEQITRAWDLAALDLTDPPPEPSAATPEDTARRAEAAAMASTGIT
ncbi:MAG: TldD/PmbA family protein, partial [Rhodoferax sp.]|nr:TldD/PmbA family protein [Pseudorhodobacter sp.]